METKQCPICGEEIAADAKKCRYCGEWIEEKIESSRQTSESDKRPKLTIVDAGGKDECTGFFIARFIEPFLKWKSEYQIPRKAFWLSILAYYIVILGLSGLAMLLAATVENVGIIIAAILLIIFSLYTIVPFFKLSAGRLRDAGYSPWLNLLVLIPVFGSIALIVLWCIPSNFEHMPRCVKFGMIDAIITFVSVALIVVGSITLVNNLSKLFNDNYVYDYESQYNYSDVSPDEEVEVIVDNTSFATDTTGYEIVAETAEIYFDDDTEMGGDPDFVGVFDGKVGNYPIQMNIVVINGNEISGHYYYKSQGEDRQIELCGTLSKNIYETSKNAKSQAIVYELDKGNNKCGCFELVFTQINDAEFTSEKRFTITGTYKNYSSGRTFNVELSKY